MSSHSSGADRLRLASAARRDKRREETRAAILRESARLFQEEGFEAFSLRKVAESIGYSPTTIYLYFEDKDALLHEVAYEGFHRFGERLQQAYDAYDDPLARLRALGEAYIAFGLERPLHYRLMFMQRPDFLTRRPSEARASIIDGFSVLLRAVTVCLDTGCVALPPGIGLRGLGAMIWSQVHGIVALAVAGSSIAPEDAVALTGPYLDMLIEGLRVR